jgi:hypothetical protein
MFGSALRACLNAVSARLFTLARAAASRAVQELELRAESHRRSRFCALTPRMQDLPALRGQSRLSKWLTVTFLVMLVSEFGFASSHDLVSVLANLPR